MIINQFVKKISSKKMNKLQFLKTSNKKILAINGSHRNGNTQYALKKIIDIVNQSSPTNHGILINLHEHNIQYSTEADYNQPTQNDKVTDDMAIIYPLLQSADLIIFGSPLYFYNVSGRMKTFIDRLNKYYWDHKLKNKQVFTVGVGGSTQPTQMLNTLNKFYEDVGMKNLGYEFFRAEHPDDLQKNEQANKTLQRRAKQFVL